MSALAYATRAVPVLFVRHGQSTNNILLGELYERQLKGELTAQQREELWLKGRSDDPDLTPLGKEEATKLGNWLKSSGVTARRRITIFPSPFKRTLDTAAAIRLATPDAAVVVRPDIYEVGGVYTQTPTGQRGGPGNCLSASGIAGAFSGFDTSLLPQSGQWYTAGWESDAEGRERSERVAGWIRSKDFRQRVGQDGLAVMGHFIDLLQKSLLGILSDASKDPKSTNGALDQATRFSTANTATSLFEVSEGGNVVVYWIASTEHLGHSAEHRLGRL